MSKSQKLLISFGAFIIVAIMVIGAFSLGVYVGERGWTAGSPSMAGVGEQPPPQGQRVEPGKQPTAPREPLPKETPDLIGVVQSVARRSVTIKTGEGPRLVLVSDETRVERAGGQEASLADLRRNVPVAVFGEFSDDGHTLVASVIVILPPKT
ncbi:MAG: hypothetical protein ISS49_05855 [Anaerolineae bacterium]|nr:hypothetical protein [Anaerolineae bacterium]